MPCLRIWLRLDGDEEAEDVDGGDNDVNGGDDRPRTIGDARLRCVRLNDGHHCKRFGESLYSALISKLGTLVLVKRATQKHNSTK